MSTSINTTTSTTTSTTANTGASKTNRHCLVIGAGAVGANCALSLVQKGLRVTLVDRGDPGQATSYGNAGCISPSQLVPFSYPGVWKRIPRWLLDELGPLTIRWQHLPWVAPWLWQFWRAGTAAGVRRCAEAQAQLMHRVTADYAAVLALSGQSDKCSAKGLIVLFDTAAEFEAAKWQYELDAELGFDWRRLSEDEVRSLAPALHFPPGGAAILIPCWQHLSDPGQVTAGIAQAAIERGVNLIREEVSAVEAGPQGVRARTRTGLELEADSLVVAAGPWSNQLAGQLDYRVPITPKRGYHSMIAEPGIKLDLPVMSASRSFVITPMAAGLRIAGTAEFARLDAEPNYRRADVLMQHGSHYLPGLQLQGVKQWMGQRPMMCDSVPVISRSPRHANVWYAIGHGHYGLTQGPTTGRIIADLVAGEDPGLDLRPYRFDRFRRP